MRKLLSSGLVFFGVVSLPARVSGPLPQPQVEKTRDPRLNALRTFFERSESPAAGLAEDFILAADAYQLDWRLLPSISIVESGGGKNARNNNWFGWDSGRAQFASAGEGIYWVAYQLSRSRLYRGKNLHQKLRNYNCVDASYPSRIASLMRRIAN
ncbi:MAG: glucosaminidase domain-containing protein [Bryobacterales bacterium]|nr:glucosaminidase domain-containing protein [Bryobacterales bacterium]